MWWKLFLTNLILYIINEFKNKNIYSTCLHHDFCRKQIECFDIYIPKNKFPNSLNEEDTDLVIEETVNDKNLGKSDTEKTYESIQEIKFPQQFEDGAINIVDDLNENEMKDPRVQALFKWSRHNSLFVFIINQDDYELPKKTIRANEKIYHIFEPSNFGDVQKL